MLINDDARHTKLRQINNNRDQFNNLTPKLIKNSHSMWDTIVLLIAVNQKLHSDFSVREEANSKKKTTKKQNICIDSLNHKCQEICEYSYLDGGC